MLKITVKFLLLGQLIRKVLLMLLDCLQVLLLIFVNHWRLVNFSEGLFMFQLLSNKHFAEWLLRSDAFQELFFVQPAVIIQVQAPNYRCIVFYFYAFRPIPLEEAIKRFDVDVRNICGIDGRVN